MLLLRKECQDALDNLGFNEAHVEVKSKQLVIVGECGKVIIALPTISFYGTKVTKAERSFAVELFNKALDKYGTEFKKFRQARKEIPDIVEVPEGFTLRYGVLEYETNDKVKYMFYSSGSMSIGKCNLSELNKNKVLELQAKADEYFLLAFTRDTKIKKADDLGKTIARCDI